MDVLPKPGVEETEQMTQNRMDILQSKNQRERKLRLIDMYEVVISHSNLIYA